MDQNSTHVRGACSSRQLPIPCPINRGRKWSSRTLRASRSGFSPDSCWPADLSPEKKGHYSAGYYRRATVNAACGHLSSGPSTEPVTVQAAPASKRAVVIAAYLFPGPSFQHSVFWPVPVAVYGIAAPAPSPDQLFRRTAAARWPSRSPPAVWSLRGDDVHGHAVAATVFPATTPIGT